MFTRVQGWFLINFWKSLLNTYLSQNWTLVTLLRRSCVTLTVMIIDYFTDYIRLSPGFRSVNTNNCLIRADKHFDLIFHRPTSPHLTWPTLTFISIENQCLHLDIARPPYWQPLNPFKLVLHRELTSKTLQARVGRIKQKYENCSSTTMKTVKAWLLENVWQVARVINSGNLNMIISSE